MSIPRRNKLNETYIARGLVPPALCVIPRPPPAFLLQVLDVTAAAAAAAATSSSSFLPVAIVPGNLLRFFVPSASVLWAPLNLVTLHDAVIPILVGPFMQAIADPLLVFFAAETTIVRGVDLFDGVGVVGTDQRQKKGKDH